MHLDPLRRYFPLQYDKPDPAFVAAQLRRPHGEFAGKIAAKMDEVNTPLFELTAGAMELDGAEKVLEIGFGSGRNFARLLEKHPELKLCGLDYSTEMVQSARELHEGAVEAGRLEVREGSSDGMPYPDDTFDKVYCNMVIYFWEEPDPHLREIRRVLKPGGSFYTGLRTRESMHQLPFIEHGFTLYGVTDWSTVLQRNDFQPAGIHTSLDPPFEEAGQTLRMESVCLAATASP
ncbi:MAG: class I SAM-dependent methyltransferase [Balneolaceae bacterium]|nr:class I SAM-dependent methyltransferase [Balneolaceae bacterium]